MVEVTPPQGTPQAAEDLGTPLITPQGDEPSSPSNPRPSIQFLLGQLSAQVASQQQTLRDLPGVVTALLSPQLAAHAVRLANHDSRLDTIERRMYLVWGGGAVIVALGAAGLKFYPMIVR